jgi:hypothetical protein
MPELPFQKPQLRFKGFSVLYSRASCKAQQPWQNRMGRRIWLTCRNDLRR